jgi:carbamoyl-phosphate synthase small subunit
MPCAFGTAPVSELLAAAEAEPGTLGMDLVAQVTTGEAYKVGDLRTRGRHSVVAYDFGIKTAILRHLSRTVDVEVVPASTPAADVLSRGPDGVFLSNGPGDPAALDHLVREIGALLGAVPVFGICLGHQLLARALGGETYKLRFGHHGGNHPVKRIETGAIEITSQNHGYAVADGTVSGAAVSHVNLNDGVIEGLRCVDVPAFSVQYHPEAGPGPHDARYLFDEFRSLMAAGS